jgi:hypothetical protein
VPVGDWPEQEIRTSDAVWDFLLAVEELWEPGPYELAEVKREATPWRRG